MSVPVTIENDALRLEVWPQFGGKISSLVDKADGHELLFTYPAELPTRCLYGTDYTRGWFGGWDECFPSVDAGPYPLHPYEGVMVPDHGETWSLPTTAVPTRDGITTVWHGLRFGYRLTRKLYLEAADVVAEYTLINLAPFEFRFVWAMHALLSMTSAVTIDPVGGGGGPLHLADAAGAPTQWPDLDGTLRFTRSDDLPAGRVWKLFGRDPVAGTARITYPDRRRRLDVAYTSESDLPAYWAVWVNTGGWEGQRHIALEPMTGRSDVLQRCVADGSAGTVPPSGRVDWAVRLGVGVS